MLIIPAIDLINGRCVRLLEGEFDQVTNYSDQPVEQIKDFAEAGASMIHIVDLDGAKAGHPVQSTLINDLAEAVTCDIQVAGGIRAENHLSTALKSRARRIVIGSQAALNPDNVAEWVEKYGAEKVTLAFDIRIQDGTPYAATHGWKKQSALSLWDLIDIYEGFLGLNLLVTDISKDGTLAGPNLNLMSEIKQRHPSLFLQASGGIGCLNDLEQVRDCGADAIIIGRALYEGKFTLPEAIQVGAEHAGT